MGDSLGPDSPYRGRLRASESGVGWSGAWRSTVRRSRPLILGGYVVIEALHPLGAPSGTLANANRFVCVDGKTYWVKLTAQYGLAAEVIAGRLAAALGAGPLTRIIRVPSTRAGDAGHLVGLGGGSEDQPGAFNGKDISNFVHNGTLAPGSLDPRFLARTLVFQTWIGVQDQQVLLRLTDGAVLSIDHGGCFGDTSTRADPVVIETSIPGISETERKRHDLLDAELLSLEAVTEGDLLQAVAGIPDDDDWKGDPARRLSIAEWLLYRQSRVRGVIEAWVRR
jgi:hypothetical protein